MSPNVTRAQTLSMGWADARRYARSASFCPPARTRGRRRKQIVAQDANVLPQRTTSRRPQLAVQPRPSGRTLATQPRGTSHPSLPGSAPRPPRVRGPSSDIPIRTPSETRCPNSCSDLHWCSMEVPPTRQRLGVSSQNTCGMCSSLVSILTWLYLCVSILTHGVVISNVRSVY